MGTSPLLDLQQMGQSVWCDSISRSLLDSGELRRMIAEDGLRGVTSNPSIFEKAISGGMDYDREIRTMARAGFSAERIYEVLAIKDIQRAADQFRALFEATGGGDGYVSLEVSPHLAYRTRETVEEARRLWQAVARPNVMIKVPATPAGMPAIRQLLGEGINVNITLMFSMEHYLQVAEAYLQGIETLAASAHPVSGRLGSQLLCQPRRQRGRQAAAGTGVRGRQRSRDRTLPKASGLRRCRQCTPGLPKIQGDL